MDDDREETIRNVTEALAAAMIKDNADAAVHLARLVMLDRDRDNLLWFADELARALQGWDVNTRGLTTSDVSLLIQAAARRLVNSGE
jgi:hypothetical protein